MTEKRRKQNREAQRRYRQKKQKEAITQNAVSNSESIEIRTVDDLRGILQEQVNLVRSTSEGDVLTRARLIGYLVGQGLRILETSELERRIAAIEKKLGLEV